MAIFYISFSAENEMTNAVLCYAFSKFCVTEKSELKLTQIHITKMD